MEPTKSRRPSSWAHWLWAQRRFVAVLLVLVMVASRFVPPPAPPLVRSEPVANVGATIDITAAVILDRMANAYAACRSYQDEGVVRTTFRGNWWPSHVSQVTFRTAFVRPDKFRFEFTKTDGLILASRDRQVIWGEGTTFNCWGTINQTEVEMNSLDMVVAGATGVSGGSAHTIANLLLPRVVTGRSLHEIRDAAVVEIESVDGHECYKLNSLDPDDHGLILWIDCQSFLARRMFYTHHLANGAVAENLTVYDPKFDVVIDESTFRFEPPS